METGVVIRALLFLIGFLLTLIGIAYWVRRWALGGISGGQRVSVVARLPLPPKAMLYALRVGDLVLLLGVTEHTVTVLREYSISEWEALPATPQLRISPLQALRLQTPTAHRAG